MSSDRSQSGQHHQDDRTGWRAAAEGVWGAACGLSMPSRPVTLPWLPHQSLPQSRLDAVHIRRCIIIVVVRGPGATYGCVLTVFRRAMGRGGLHPVDGLSLLSLL